MNYLGRQDANLNGSFNGGVWSCIGPFTASENGTIATIEWYIARRASAINAVFGVYADSAGTPAERLDYTDTVAVPAAPRAWVSASAKLAGSLVAGNKYWVACLAQDIVDNYYASGTTESFKQKNIGYGAMPSSAPTGLSTSAGVTVNVRIGYTTGKPWLVKNNIQLLG